MEMNRAMRLFIKNEVASESARWIHQAMSVLQTENKDNTVKSFLAELEEGIADVRTNYIQIVLLRHRTLQKKPFYQLQIFGLNFILLRRWLKRICNGTGCMNLIMSSVRK